MVNVEAAGEPTLVRLDESAANEAKAILYQAYRHEPTFQYLFDYQRPGYDQRVRATIRELIAVYFQKSHDVFGVEVDESLVAVAFIGGPEVRLSLGRNINWRLRMMLTAGFSSTRRYVDYHEQIRASLPRRAVHELPLMGVHPRHQNRGFGRFLLAAVERLCAENPQSAAIALDTGNSRYVQFYESMGYRNVGQVKLGDVTEFLLCKALR